MVTPSEIQQVFEKILALNGKRSVKENLTYKEFEDAFNHIVPRIGSHSFETLVIKKVREWMFNKQYNTKTSYERLVRSSDRLDKLSMRRYDFHRAIIINRIQMSYPEIDFLFDTLTGGEGELTFDLWTARIYDDITNPL
jgi:hypothetical protein